jgi:hypothetical protein
MNYYLGLSRDQLDRLQEAVEEGRAMERRSLLIEISSSLLLAWKDGMHMLQMFLPT